MSTLLLIRRMHASVPPPRLTRFALHPPKSVIRFSPFAVLDIYPLKGSTHTYEQEGKVEVEFSDGSVFSLSAEFLRVYSPAADSKIRSIGGEKVVSGRRHVGIMSAETVGNYGVRIIFDDLHNTGIYTWDYFHQLGTSKFTLMRNYIKTLKKHGLSRDPQRRK